MTEEALEQSPEHQPAPPPVENPRAAVMREIAKQAFASHDAEAKEHEAVPTVTDEHVQSEAPPPAPEPAPAAAAEQAATPSAEPSAPPPAPAPAAGAPAEEALDPNKEYEIIVEGQKMMVKGSAIIDAGKRTFSKEAAADHRLRLASQLLEEAERRAAATPQGAPQPAQPAQPQDRTVEQLAHALQFGTPEESAAAVRALQAGGMSQEKLMPLIEERSRLVAADEFEFRRGQAMLHHEYKDLMERPALRRLFESEDARLLQGGDRRPYIERYRAIGENLRKEFGIARPAAPAPASSQPPAGTVAARQEAKAKAPSVPRTAAARLGEGGSSPAKPVSPSDVIAGMAAARGKNRLIDPPATNRR